MAPHPGAAPQATECCRSYPARWRKPAAASSSSRGWRIVRQDRLMTRWEPLQRFYYSARGARSALQGSRNRSCLTCNVCCFAREEQRSNQRRREFFPRLGTACDDVAIGAACERVLLPVVAPRAFELCRGIAVPAQYRLKTSHRAFHDLRFACV